MNSNYKSIILVIGLFFALPSLILAAPGDLDLSFGSGGIVVTSFAGYGYDEARTVRVQPDGKIVVCGQVFDGDGNEVSSFLARYHPTGALDASFGTNGKIIIPYFPGVMVGGDIALQPDGKIITVGYGFSGGGYAFAVHRYNANGTLDASFGTGGVVITPTAPGIAYSVAIQADGKIVAAGYSFSAGQSYEDFTVVRLLPDGSLDTSFGGTGKVITSFGNHSLARRVFIQPDGKIVAAGNVGLTTGSISFVLARYNADGSLDSSFGAGGKVSQSIPNGRILLDVALQPDGKIVAAGEIVFAASGTVIARYNQNGLLDTSFAAGGIFTTEADFIVGNGIALQPDSKIVAFGGSRVGGGGNNRFAIARLNPNGAPDTSFGANGRVIMPIGNYSHAADGAVQADGKILAFGRDDSSSNILNIAIVRYLGDSAVPRPAQFDFDGDRRADLSVFRPTDRTWYLNQSTNGFSATQFGLSTDQMTPADFDGDGKTDIAVFRDGVWYWLNSSNSSFNAAQFGLPNDIPVPADFTGDGRVEIGVYRGGVWYTLNLSNNQTGAVQFGISTDKPVVGDYDGDGRADFAVYRNGTWYLLQSTQGFAAAQFGLPNDKTVSADYDGDGKTDLAVYRDGVWYLLGSNEGFTAFQFGVSTDTPAPADYDGDGRADAAVYRNGTWHLRQSANGFAAVSFGLTNDKPVPAAYLP